MPSKYEVSVIIVNFNGKKYLETLFDALIKQECDGFDFEIVFSDNASEDDSIEFLNTNYAEKLGSRLVIVRNKKNLGFAGGNNAGVSASSGKHLAFLNNDTKPDKQWLNNLYHYIKEKPEYGIVNSKLLFFHDFIKITFETDGEAQIKKDITVNGKAYTIDGKFCSNVQYGDLITCSKDSFIYIPLTDGNTDYRIDIISAPGTDPLLFKLSCCGIDTPPDGDNITRIAISGKVTDSHKVTLIQNAGSAITGNLHGYDIGFCREDCDEFKNPYEVQSGCGAAIMMRKEDFIACGGFDDRFFMYYEDTDLSFRMRKTGKKIMYCPDAVVRHIHTGSSKEWSPMFTYYVTRNRLLFIYKNISRKISLKSAAIDLYGSFRRKDRVRFKAHLSVFKFLVTDMLFKRSYR